MAKEPKFYVVWEGLKPGIYKTWAECNKQVFGYPGAKYKSFPSMAEAEVAFKSKPPTYARKAAAGATSGSKKVPKSSIIMESISVDAACSGNPGLMEYRGVLTSTGEQLFHQGPYKMGTNNVGEFLAIIHGLAFLIQQGKMSTPIYSDSQNAINWVKKKTMNTKLERIPANAELWKLIDRAVLWMQQNTWKNPILKWETESWGEIPADFGRKS